MYVRGEWVAGNPAPARRGNSSGLPCAPARNSQPGGSPLQAAVDRRLHRAQCFNSPGNAGASGHSLMPHTLHLRAHFATSIAAYATTWTVAQILWTIHG